MKNCFFAMVICTACALAACSDTTTPATTFPTYKYSFTGRISNPKNLTIPNDAYLSVVWEVSKGEPDYGYFYGEGYLDRTKNTFTIGFNEDLPVEALNRNDSNVGGLGVAGVQLLTSPTSKPKLIGKQLSEPSEKDYKVWGGMNWSGIIYIGGDSSKVDWRSWAKNFKQGYNYAIGVDNGTTFDDFAPADTKDIVLLIDTVKSSFRFPNWTGANPNNNPTKEARIVQVIDNHYAYLIPYQNSP